MAKYFKYHSTLQHDLEQGFQLEYTHGQRFQENLSCGPNVLRIIIFYKTQN